MRMKLGLALILLLSTTIISATPSRSGESITNTVAIVDIAKFNFTPAEIRIPAGRSVKWVNRDAFVHTVTSGEVEKQRRNTVKHPDGKFDSGDIKQEQSYTTTFKEKGIYPYYCDTHPFMVGKVIVK